MLGHAAPLVCALHERTSFPGHFHGSADGTSSLLFTCQRAGSVRSCLGIFFEQNGSGDELWDGVAPAEDGAGSAVEVVDHEVIGVDAEVVVDGCEKIVVGDAVADDVFGISVGFSDDAAGLDSASGPDV